MQKLQKYSDLCPAVSVPALRLAVVERQFFFFPLFLYFPSQPPENDVLVTPCQRQQDTVCRCQEGYYKSHINSETYQCLKCTACAPNEKKRKTCESDK